jgi:thimet oligopeptidase
MYRASQSRGAPANLDVLQRMIARRHELATLLGYPHWAAYVTEDKMIRTAENAAAFIGRVTELTGARQDAEVAELLALLRREQPDAEVVRDWDRGVLMEQVRRERLDFDGRDARPYLPYAQVKAGVLDVAGRLYGLEFRRAEVPVWHPDVEAWDILEDGAPRARFYLDMHPRTDKYKHAAMFDLVSGIRDAVLPEACLVCNLPQPSADDPALLEPDDVTTFFHEFGHLLHHLLAGRQRWLSVSGISTEWDFVEVPSQLFEEWAFDADVLARFARHHETGEPIPAGLVARMRAANEYGKGIRTRMQMFYAALALEYFSRDPEGVDTTEVIRKLKPRYVPYPHEEGTTFQAAFGHLDGYSALYYTYMWSLVLAKDLFSAFDGRLMDRELAARYRRSVLEPGGSRDADALVQDFLGRPSAFDAFERWLAA